MPYLLLALGFIAGCFGLYRVFVSSNSDTIKDLIAYAILAVLVVSLIFLAVTGRLWLAIGGTVILLVIILRVWFVRKAKKNVQHNDDQDEPPLLK